MKKIPTKYNQSNVLLVISAYPQKGRLYAAGTGGVASFAKNTLAPLAKQGQKIVVLANKINGKKEIYQEGNILVIRCWQRGSFFLFGDLLREIRKFGKIGKILIQFEFALYDGLWKTLFFPWFILTLRLRGKKTILVLHQVIFNLSQLSGHLGWKKKSFIAKIFSLGIKAFYWLMANFSHRVIVLETKFKKRLVGLGIKKEKIKIITHGVDTTLEPISQFKAKKMLGFRQEEKIILVFGFLTWYKGSDLILKQFKKYLSRHPRTKIRLILAGGESQTQKDKSHYRQYLSKLYQLEKNLPRAKITGFIAEKQIAIYFSAADWVVLPYRTFMSSSGPLSLAITFKRPFLISPKYSQILATPDFEKAMKSCGLVKKDLLWQGFNSLPSLTARKRIQKLVEQIRSERDFKTLGENYLRTIESLAEHPLPSPALQTAPAVLKNQLGE